MSSWTGWKSAIAKSPSYLLVFFFLGLASIAVRAQNISRCASQKATAQSLSAPSTTKSWSADFILKTELEIEQGLWDGCLLRSESDTVSRLLQSAFLGRLGVVSIPTDPAQLEILFRGFITTSEQSGPLIQTLARKNEKAPLDLLREIYGSVDLLDGIVIVGPKSLTAEAGRLFGALRDRVCAKRAACALWDPHFLFKIVITKEPGLAAYTPQTGVLILSAELVQTPGELPQLVILHEWAHLALYRAQKALGQDWLAEFAALTGWSRNKAQWKPPPKLAFVEYNDGLTRGLQPASFAIQESKVAFPSPSAKLDGCVLERGRRAAIERADPAEEFADAVAVYVVAPERFCPKGRPLAPHLGRWLFETVFQNQLPFLCKDRSRPK